jgi:hypothetical protein
MSVSRTGRHANSNLALAVACFCLIDIRAHRRFGSLDPISPAMGISAVRR